MQRLDDDQRRAGLPRRRAAPAARALHPRDARPDRHPLGLRHLELRRLRRADGRQAGQVVHDARGDVRGPRDPHRRVARGGRRARPDPAGLPRAARAAVRVLHAGHADDRRARCWTRTRIRPSTRSAPRSRARSAAAPGYKNIVAPCAGPPSTRPQPSRRHEHGDDREPSEPDHRAPDRLRPAEAQGGRALHPRPGHLPRRHQAAGHGATARSCAARTRTRASSRSTPRAALAHPNVAAVVTAKDLETLGLAWMPTISYDTQAVLAGDKVRFQGQEVAFVIATDEYSANDALQLIDVEYEPLPAVVNARKALDPDAPLIRDDKAGQRDNLASPTWEAGDEEATDRAFAEADTDRHARHHLPALPPGAARDVRDHRRLQPEDRPARHLQRQPGAARPPHGLRARRRARRAHDPDPLPRHRRRLRQQGAGLPGLRVRDRRLDRGRRAGQVGREPLREPDVHRLRPRLHHAAARCARRTARSPACAST